MPSTLDSTPAEVKFETPIGFPEPEIGDPVAPVDPAAEAAPPITRSASIAKKKPSTALIAVVAAVIVIVLFAILFHKPTPKPKPVQDPQAAVLSGSKASESAAQEAANKAVTQAAPSASLPTEQTPPPVNPAKEQNTSPDDILHTRAPKQPGEQASGSTAPLGTVPNFQNNQQRGAGQGWEPPAYDPNGDGTGVGGANSKEGSQSGGSQSVDRAATTRMAQVTKPSIVFVLSSDASQQARLANGAAAKTDEPEIDNFGYEPGFHLAAHLESVATTATKAPTIAVVDYNYRRNGETIIPAGSRVTGEIENATSTGIAGIRFTTIRLPDGQTIPISAIALDQQMGPIKGIVTGRNRAKQFLIAAMAGIGMTGSMMLGNNNSSGTLSESDLMRAQLAQNMGQAADMQIQQLQVSEHIIVSVPAGTQVEVTFIAPAKKANAQK